MMTVVTLTGTDAELLLMRDECEAVLNAPFDDNLGERIAAMNTVKRINTELSRRTTPIQWDPAAHDRYMSAVAKDYEQGIRY